MKATFDDIKWMCEKADGFRVLSGNQIETPNKAWFYYEEFLNQDATAVKVIYPLLLQKAINGVNKIPKGDDIEQRRDHVCVGQHKYWYYDEMSEDEASESALLYVREIEDKV